MLTMNLLPQVDNTPRLAPKMKGTPRIPPGVFNDALREANVCNLYLLFNALTNMLSVAHSSIPIPWATY
jgi:hypothetical protein